MNIYAHRSEAGRSLSVFCLIFAESLATGLLTAWAYACSLDGQFSPQAFTLPAVFEISSTVGLFMGALLSPFVYLSMRHLRFFIRSAYYLLVIIAAAVFEMWLHSGFSGAIVIALSTCIVCAFTQRSCDV